MQTSKRLRPGEWEKDEKVQINTGYKKANEVTRKNLHSNIFKLIHGWENPWDFTKRFTF